MLTIREYPDISFVDTDTDTVANAMIKSYEEKTGRTLYPADPARIMILWAANIIVQERVNIDFSAKQNVPRYATGDYLDSLAELFRDTERLEPEKARTTLRFTLSVVLEVATIIPAGTRVTVGGDIVFQTMKDLTILAGSISGDVEAECLTAGEIGNGFVPGQLNTLIDIFPYYQSVENITETAGGADRESDAAFYDRLRESMETFSTAGPVYGYEYFAKSASALISDVKATSPTPGVVDVRILLQGGETPGEEIIQRVQETLSADNVRPLGDYVTVSAPDIIEFNIDFTYHEQAGSAFSSETVAENVQKAVADYKAWQSAKMGRDVNPSQLSYLLMQTGIKRVEIREPQFTAVSETAVARAAEETIVNGGAEDE